MSRPRSNSDPSDNKAKAPLAPSLASAKNPVRAEIAHWGKKSSSGYVGLSNQGATCYLNSLLQCLYMTPEFRHSLFKWKYKPPPDSTFDFEFMDPSQSIDDNNTNTIDGIYDAPPEHSIPFQLQCLFARLHKSCRGSCSTIPLTKSFHWDDGQAFQQHDVQELLRVLFDAVSRALSRVGKHDLLNDLCKGLLLDYLDCQECHSDRARSDIFLDLSLTIEHINSLEDAINKFITPEIMSGGNQVNCYQCDKKQDFKKGLKFKKLPPLLLIQLKRFHFNWELNRRIKLSHKVTFPKQLDMAQYIDKDILNDMNKDDLKYSLYGVIIQSGGALGGHYYAFIKSFDDDKWYCFNDSSVRELDDKNNEFDNAFGGESVRGTGYVLLYRQKNLKLPKDYGYFPKYLINMIQKEDELIKIQWEQWQKEMRTITVTVTYTNGKPLIINPKKSEEKTDINPIAKLNENGTELTLKLDVEEYTFLELLELVRTQFGINDEEIPTQNTRLRKYYPNYNFIAEGYDDVDLEQSKIETAKWPKRGLNLILEIKDDINKKFEYFDPNHIMISLFVVTDSNTAALVDRGFVQSATFKPQDLPPGAICSVVVDSKAVLSKIKPILYDALKENNIVPSEWLIECDNDRDTFDAQNLNLIKFDYNKIRLFCDDDKNLVDHNIKLGTMIFIEKQSESSLTENHDEKQTDSDKIKLAEIPKLSPLYQRSKLCVLFEEQRLKISVQFNDPLPAKSIKDRVQELLMTPEMLRKRRSVDKVFNNKRSLEFNHALRLSKECSLSQLKGQIALELGLELNEFRLRKSSNQPELRDMNMTLNAAGIGDGGLVYVEYGVPTKPKEICITFALYDINKVLTDPHKRKRTLAQKLFEFPFPKDIKVSVLKKEIVNVINKLFPLYRNKYNFIEAIKVLKREEKEENEREIEELKKATELSKKGNVDVVASVTETIEPLIAKNEVSESKTESNDNRKMMNLFGIDHIRLRKQKGAKVLEMLFDDRTLSNQIIGKKDSLQLVIEKIPIREHFTKNHLCFWLQKYRLDHGKSWNGKIYKKKEFVIDKKSKIIDLKRLIANLLKKSDKSYINIDDDEIIKNISITKGFSTSPMKLSNINRVQWVHRAALHQIGIDPDHYYYKLNENESNNDNNSKSDDKSNDTAVKSDNKTKDDDNNTKSDDINTENVINTYKSHNGKIYKEEELLNVMQNALLSENDDIIGRPPFHLRNGDLIVWSDIKWKPKENQIFEKRKLEKKKGFALKKNKDFVGTKGATLLSKIRKEPEQLKIRTYIEFMDDERKRKEKEEKEKILKEKELKEKRDNNENNDNDKDLSENAKLFNAMVAEDINDIQNPKPKNTRNRGGSF